MTATSGANPSHVVEDQSEVFNLLGSPSTHGGEAVTRIDTHGAAVFLAGERAYKVKRAVRFPFMDFSTLEKRRAACAAEVAVNAPGAPGLYLGVVPVTRQPSGLRLGGSGEPVDYAVEMTRFDEASTLDVLADQGRLTSAIVKDAVEAILASHARAPLRDGRKAADSLRTYLDQNRSAFVENADIFPPDRADRLVDAGIAEWERVEGLLVDRGAAGLVRRCHGDLHLRNIALLEGRPTLFDAIEFSDEIATCDVLYDLAYLLMDLVERGLRAEANLVQNRYLWNAEEANLDGLAALPLFISLRASIRAKVVAAARPNMSPSERERAARDAVRYFEIAEASLVGVKPRLVAVGGLSGTGKSTLAARLAPRIGRIPGAVHLRSDVLRKRLAGITETDQIPPELYTPARSDEVYARLRQQARRILKAGSAVVIDAVHARPEERTASASLAAAEGAGFAGLWLTAPAGVLVDRVEGRTGDASDADAAVVALQGRYELGPVDWDIIDASGSMDATEAAAVAVLEAVHRLKTCGAPDRRARSRRSIDKSSGPHGKHTRR